MFLTVRNPNDKKCFRKIKKKEVISLGFGEFTTNSPKSLKMRNHLKTQTLIQKRF